MSCVTDLWHRAVWCLDQPCTWPKEGDEGDAGTSRMEAEMPAADGNVLSLNPAGQE